MCQSNYNKDPKTSVMMISKEAENAHVYKFSLTDFARYKSLCTNRMHHSNRSTVQCKYVGVLPLR